MTIEEFMKKSGLMAEVAFGERALSWVDHKWRVIWLNPLPSNAVRASCLYSGPSLEAALKVLEKGKKE